MIVPRMHVLRQKQNGDGVGSHGCLPGGRRGDVVTAAAGVPYDEVASKGRGVTARRTEP